MLTDETRSSGSAKVRRFRIIGTASVVYQAWERRDGHSTITTFPFDEGVVGTGANWFGRIGCRALPAELEALPAGSDARVAAVTAWHLAQYEEAYAAIVAVFPEAAGGRRDMGEISLSDPIVAVPS